MRAVAGVVACALCVGFVIKPQGDKMTIEKREVWLIYRRPFSDRSGRHLIGAAPTKAEAERMGHYLNGEGSWDSAEIEGPFSIYYGATEAAVKEARVERERVDAEIKAAEARLQSLKLARV